MWSKDPETKYFPNGENTKLETVKECPFRVQMHSPLDTVYRFILLSIDPDAKIFPFGEKTMLSTL